MSLQLKLAAIAAARIASAVSLALAGVTAASAAQSPPEDEIQEMVITGTRIASPNQTSTSPILAIGADEIRSGGRADVTSMLNVLPQLNSNALGQDLGNQTTGLSTPGGVATADLRGLGPHRTLVLVNGRRLGTGSPQTSIASPAPDIDQVPAALLERVEIVTGGASAVYGSDAIAGVVNFITRRNFEGLQADLQLGGNWHDNHSDFVQGKLADAGFPAAAGNTWDGRTVNASLTAGANLADGRGNVTAFLGYQSMDPVRSSQRDFGGCQLGYNDALDDLECNGASSNSNSFRPTGAINPDDTVYSVLGHSFVEKGSVDTTPPAAFNTQPYIYMQRQDTRYNAGLLADIEVSSGFRPYLEFMFMDDRTHQEVAPTGLFKNSNVLTADNNYLVNCSNPLLSEQQQSLLCTPAQVAADALDPGSVNADVEIGRRNIEGGARTYDYQHSNYRFVVGSKGALADGWTYDGYGQYYYTNFQTQNGRDFSYDKISNALQVETGPDGALRCISAVARQSGCVPYNIFSDGGVTQDQLAYLETLGTATGNTELNTWHVDVTGDLGTYGLKLPAAETGVGVNAGYEYRRERIHYAPDAAYESGLLAGVGGALPRIDASLAVSEYFGEVRVPIVEGRPGVHDLVADAGYRYSDYSSGVQTDTYKLELQYAPVQDLRLRASYNRAIRAPSIVELYNAPLVAKIDFGEDPCAPSEATGVAARSLADCLRTGVTPAQYGNGGTTNTIPQGTADQLTQLQSGNAALKPERGDTYTLGVTFQPAALPAFTGSVDYYHIKLKDTIGVLPAATIVNTCLDTGDSFYCSQISRHPITGTLNGASVAGGGYIIQSNVNIGANELSGIDVQAAYRFDIGDLGALRLMLNGAYLLAYESTPIEGGDSYDCAGLFGYTCQTVNPKWRHTLRTSWDLSHALSLVATWRFSSSVDLDNNTSNPLLAGYLGGVATYRARIPSISYLDLAASWDFTEHLQVRGGINNALDRDPPVVPAALTNGGAANYIPYYDGLGRQVFAAVTMKF